MSMADTSKVSLSSIYKKCVRTGKIADLARPSYTVAPQLQVGWFTNVLFQFIVQRCCGFDSVLNFLQPYLKLLVRDFPTVKTPDLDTLNFLFSLVYICFATGVSTKVLVFQLTREDLHSLEASRSFEMKTPSNVDLMSDLFISALKIYSIAKIREERKRFGYI
ncbi:hypothetical protein BC829DRAFT_261144 [Chytridium lagenaria]|nr:hypothetical protein BC829DRAFT_261144 [Chytridium lagenaria]